MRPVRISLQNRTYEEFAEDLTKCFANALMADEDRLRSFYDQMVAQYRTIILDLDTSILLMALTFNAGWILCEYYIRNTPTPSTLDAYLEKQAQEQEATHEEDGWDMGATASSSDTKKFTPNEDLFNNIIEKMGILGNIESLTKGEREYLNKVAKYYREIGGK